MPLTSPLTHYLSRKLIVVREILFLFFLLFVYWKNEDHKLFLSKLEEYKEDYRDQFLLLFFWEFCVPIDVPHLSSVEAYSPLTIRATSIDAQGWMQQMIIT